jgi:hypothetical protein
MIDSEAGNIGLDGELAMLLDCDLSRGGCRIRSHSSYYATMQLSDHRDDSELWAGKGVIDATVEEPDANFEVQQVESIVMKLFRMPNRRSLH